LGIGLAGQDILDLGTGTGALAVPFARQGARVTATDISEGQIRAARDSARQNHVSVTFKVAPSEATGLPEHSFDVVSSAMSWGYFDINRMLVEVPRLLRRSGKLLISSLVWIRNQDPVAKQSEALILKYNPSAVSSLNRTEAEAIPAWSKGHFRLKSYHHTTELLPFTRETWAGRIRASRFILAALPAAQAEAFDREHRDLLENHAPVRFEIAHNIRLQVFEPVR
jgi:ubiquinone/menaquinone biosynthesis C-methylase UbiE